MCPGVIPGMSEGSLWLIEDGQARIMQGFLLYDKFCTIVDVFVYIVVGYYYLEVWVETCFFYKTHWRARGRLYF